MHHGGSEAVAASLLVKNRGQTGRFPFSCRKMGNDRSGPDFDSHFAGVPKR